MPQKPENRRSVPAQIPAHSDSERGVAAQPAGSVQWAPRVPPRKILRLYETDARGIIDEELIDEVGYGLLARCESIRIVSDAYRGRITCPRCFTLVRDEGKRPTKDQRLVQCPECDWQMNWGAYRKTFQEKQLRGHNFEPELDYCLKHFPKARTPIEKMRSIDRLIHAVHKGTAKPAATNLISGKAGQLTGFLDRLAYGEESTPGVQQTKAAWDDRLRASGYWSRHLDAPDKS